MSANTEIESFLTIDELSAWIKVKKSTIYQWVIKDAIPSYKIGGKRLFEPSEIRKWLKKKSSAA